MPRTFIISVVLAMLAASTPLAAQSTSSRNIGIQLRAGATGFSPLVQDRGRAPIVVENGTVVSSELTVRQKIAPTLAVAALLPLRAATDLEVTVMFARSGLEAENDFESWDAGTASVLNAVMGLAYRLRAPLTLHGGVGLTRLSADDDVLFMQGGRTQPLLEAGVGWRPWEQSGVQLDARVQAHRFGTEALRAQGADDGAVMRVAVTGSYTFGGSAR